MEQAPTLDALVRQLSFESKTRAGRLSGDLPKLYEQCPVKAPAVFKGVLQHAEREKESGAFYETTFRSSTPTVGTQKEGVLARKNNGQVISNRIDTVDSILELAIRHSAVMIHTSPGGGKTSICQLLASRAFANESDSARYFGKVYKVDLTRMRKDKLSFEQVFQAETGTGFVGDLVSPLPEVSFDELVEEIVPTLLIIDEAQAANVDENCSLWAYLKRRSKGEMGTSRVHIVPASSHGSKHGATGTMTPWDYDEDQLILPWPRVVTPMNQAEYVIPGLNFSPQEYESMFYEMMRRLNFDTTRLQDLKFVIPERTGLHPEITMRVMDRISRGNYYTPAEMRDKTLRWLFSCEFLADVASARGVLRGNELLRRLGEPGFASVIYLICTMPNNVVSWDWLLRHDRPLLEAANRLAELGYIMLSGGHFKFASTCHLQYYMWRTLGQNIQAVANLPNDIFEMLCMAIFRLDPNVLLLTLSRSRNGNAYENLFHLELWRAFISFLPWEAMVSLEVGSIFGLAAKLDLLLQPQGMALELTQDGSNLQGHLARFARPQPPNVQAGAYWPMIQTGIIRQFAVVDLRNPSMPRVANPRHNVAYITFGVGYRSAWLQMGDKSSLLTVSGNSVLRSMAYSLERYGL